MPWTLFITTAGVTIVGGATASYKEITSFIDAISRAPKEVEDIRTDSGNIYNITFNLRDALEEGKIQDVISIDYLAQKHVRDAERPLRLTKSTLEKVVEKLHRQFRQLKVRFRSCEGN